MELPGDNQEEQAVDIQSDNQLQEEDAGSTNQALVGLVSVQILEQWPLVLQEVLVKWVPVGQEQ